MADIDNIKMYKGQDGMRGLHMAAVMLDQLTVGISAPDLETKLEPFINASSSSWLGWRVSFFHKIKT